MHGILRRIADPAVQNLDRRMQGAAPLEVREVQEADGERRRRHALLPIHAIEVMRALCQQRIRACSLAPDDRLLHRLVPLLSPQGTRKQELACIFFRLFQLVHPMPCIEGHVRAQTLQDGAARFRGVLRDEELVGVDGHDDVGAVLVKGPVHQSRQDFIMAKLSFIVALNAKGQPFRSEGA